MKRLLFVDDEARVLEGLGRVLRNHRGRWDMVFASSAAAGLMEFEREPFDVVVSDMRMPAMDGASFLALVAKHWPSTVRVVLSGQTDVRAALRASQVAHQFLTKPCEPRALEQVLERACRLRDLITNARLENLIGSLDTLPALPGTYTSLTAALARTETSIADVAAVVRQDQALSAKVLQLVNSSFFGMSQEVASVDRAVTLLGTRLIHSLALMYGIFHSMDREPLPLGFDPADEQRHGALAASLARRIATGRLQAEAAFTAALLHDIGRLLLALRSPEGFVAAHDLALAERIPIVEAEASVLGVTHAALGAYLLGVWGLPTAIIDAVRYHHAPADAGEHVELAVLVHAADALLRELDLADPDRPSASPLDEGAVRAAGFGDRLDEWRALARDAVSGGGGRD